MTYQKNLRKKLRQFLNHAVKSKVRDEVTRLQENYDSELEEGIKSKNLI